MKDKRISDEQREKSVLDFVDLTHSRTIPKLIQKLTFSYDPNGFKACTVVYQTSH